MLSRDCDKDQYWVSLNIDKVEVLKFSSITDDMARHEIKAANALELWQKVHFDFFLTEAGKISKIFTEESLIVFESFIVIYKK